MPPKSGEQYDNLYLVHQDGSYAKLCDIKDFDIGSPEPPNVKFRTGGELTYDEAPLFTYQNDPPADFLPKSYEASFTAHMWDHMSRKNIYMTLIGLTKREQRLAIREMERKRTERVRGGRRRMKQIKLGSLFDGSGGFPLAGVLHGIVPVWASEIEPFSIRVTKLRFPQMKHLGSVTDVNGAEVEPVDIITFGSPCQDLSVAGKQKGIHEGERSNLFFEAIRIIKEMRNATANKFPRFAVWENVPGAFSSNNGDDFRAVIEAFCGVCQPGVSVPRSEGGTWQPAGCVLGDGYSVAWRVYDAQYWGVPQRRKRIYLIADFGSECAGEILFESESV